MHTFRTIDTTESTVVPMVTGEFRDRGHSKLKGQYYVVVLKPGMVSLKVWPGGDVRVLVPAGKGKGKRVVAESVAPPPTPPTPPTEEEPDLTTTEVLEVEAEAEVEVEVEVTVTVELPDPEDGQAPPTPRVCECSDCATVEGSGSGSRTLGDEVDETTEADDDEEEDERRFQERVMWTDLVDQPLYQYPRQELEAVCAAVFRHWRPSPTTVTVNANPMAEVVVAEEGGDVETGMTLRDMVLVGNVVDPHELTARELEKHRVFEYMEEVVALPKKLSRAQRKTLQAVANVKARRQVNIGNMRVWPLCDVIELPEVAGPWNLFGKWAPVNMLEAMHMRQQVEITQWLLEETIMVHLSRAYMECDMGTRGDESEVYNDSFGFESHVQERAIAALTQPNTLAERVALILMKRWVDQRIVWRKYVELASHQEVVMHFSRKAAQYLRVLTWCDQHIGRVRQLKRVNIFLDMVIPPCSTLRYTLQSVLSEEPEGLKLWPGLTADFESLTMLWRQFDVLRQALRTQVVGEQSL